MNRQSPVVLIIFRRPNSTAQVFDRIRKVEPSTLFIIADGPRHGRPEELEAVEEVREVVSEIEWDCEVHRNYADENMGCRRRVSTGLNWVFDHAERAIVLEDDCVPDPSFFPFCDELLERYADHDHVFTISGNNFQDGKQRTESSYYFSRYMHCWGWATWARAWKHYRPQLKHWEQVKAQNWLNQIFESRRSARYWTKIFNRVDADEVDSWAYIWQYHIWLQSGLNIIPERNLVENIGFGEDATHTSSGEKTRSAEAVEMPLRHPPFIIRHSEADHYTQEAHFESTILERAVQKLRHMVTN